MYSLASCRRNGTDRSCLSRPGSHECVHPRALVRRSVVWKSCLQSGLQGIHGHHGPGPRQQHLEEREADGHRPAHLLGDAAESADERRGVSRIRIQHLFDAAALVVLGIDRAVGLGRDLVEAHRPATADLGQPGTDFGGLSLPDAGVRRPDGHDDGCIRVERRRRVSAVAGAQLSRLRWRSVKA